MTPSERLILAIWREEKWCGHPQPDAVIATARRCGLTVLRVLHVIRTRAEGK